MIVISKHGSSEGFGKPLAFILSDNMKPWVDRVYSYGDNPSDCSGWYIKESGRGTSKVQQTTQPLNSKVDILYSVRRRNHWQRPKENSGSLFQKAIGKVSKWILGA